MENLKNVYQETISKRKKKKNPKAGGGSLLGGFGNLFGLDQIKEDERVVKNSVLITIFD